MDLLLLGKETGKKVQGENKSKAYERKWTEIVSHYMIKDEIPVYYYCCKVYNGIANGSSVFYSSFIKHISV